MGAGGFGATDVPAGLRDVTAIAAGYYHGLALRRDGSVIARGWNAYGQTVVPASVRRAVTIAAGGFHSLAVTRRQG